MSQPSKTQRWLDLIACLVGRSFPIAFDELMQCVPAYAQGLAAGDAKAHESTRRKFERDKDELRALGIPIRTVRYSVQHGEDLEGYQIDKRDFYLPYLKIVQQLAPPSHYQSRHKPTTIEILEEDAPIALDALRRVARVPGFPLVRETRSAFRKLAFDLDVKSFDSDAPVLFVDRPGAAELTAKVRVLSDALRARKRVAFQYHGMYRGVATERDVAPYGLMFQHGHWYLVGHDEMRDDTRVFRVGRMDEVAMNSKKPGTADYAIPDDFRLSDYGEREPWQLGENDEKPLTADVRFDFPLSLWAERNDHGDLVDKLASGAQVRRFQLHQIDPFLRWILSLEGEVEIIAPEMLREEFQKLATLVAEAHNGGRA